MNIVTFPGFGLKFQISKIAFKIFGIPIAWYAVLIVFAFALALYLLKKKDGLYKIEYNKILTLAIYLIPVCFLSARIYYVIFNLNFFLQNPLEILNIRSGGLAIYGGIIGGAITCFVFCKKNKIPLLDLLDYIVPVLALRASNRKMGQFHKCRSIWV